LAKAFLKVPLAYAVNIPKQDNVTLHRLKRGGGEERLTERLIRFEHF
jgi:hypothetical protein